MVSDFSHKRWKAKFLVTKYCNIKNKIQKINIKNEVSMHVYEVCPSVKLNGEKGSSTILQTIGEKP